MVAACSLAPMALAADNPGAHEHGHARLQMAVEENRIDLMLNSPAYNLAGFEHGARTEAEKAGWRTLPAGWKPRRWSTPQRPTAA